MIRFEEITNKNIWKVCALEPFEQQKDFVAENIQSLAEAFATRNEGHNALPLAVYHDDELIGFVMIGKALWAMRTRARSSRRIIACGG